MKISNRSNDATAKNNYAFLENNILILYNIMPSIRKQKTQKRSRQQKRRQVVTSKSQPADRLKLEEKRLKLEEKKLQLEEDRQRLEEERQQLEERLESLNKTEPVNDDNLDYQLFDNGGGCGGFKKHGNKHSRQSRRILLNPDTLTETDKQPEVLEKNKEDLTQQGGCGFKKNMRPYTKSAEEKEEMRKIINQGLSSGELKLGPIGPNGNQTIVNAQNGGGKAKQQRPVSLRTAVKLLKNYYTKRN
jgi:hypothetical protein